MSASRTADRSRTRVWRPRPVDAERVGVGTALAAACGGTGWRPMPHLAAVLGQGAVAAAVRRIGFDAGPDGAWMWALLADGEHSVAVGIPGDVVQDWAVTVLQDDGVAPGGPAADAVVLLCAHAVCAHARLAGWGDMAVRGVLDAPEQVRALLGDAQWVVAGVVRTARQEVPFEVRGGDAALVRRCPQAAVPARDALPDVVFRVEIGGTRLSACRWRQVAPGDLVTVDALSHPWARAGNAVPRLRSGRRMIPFSWDGGFPRVGSAGMEADMQDETVVQATWLTDAVADAETVVTVEAGEVRMPWKQAAALVPGQVVRLDRPVDDGVWLRAGDRRIARGVLVEVDGQVAVEITEVVS